MRPATGERPVATRAESRRQRFALAQGWALRGGRRKGRRPQSELRAPQSTAHCACSREIGTGTAPWPPLPQLKSKRRGRRELRQPGVGDQELVVARVAIDPTLHPRNLVLARRLIRRIVLWEEVACA